MSVKPKVPYKTLDCEEFDLKQQVEVELPEGYTARVFRVISGHSGQQYWIQLVWAPKQNPDKPFALCNCHDGTFKFPLSMLAIQSGYCKHVRDLLVGLNKESI